jgi:hypothetical protein
VNQYDTLIRDFLSEHNTISFEKVGTLTVGNTPITAEQPLSPGTISFRYDKRAITSPELCEFIAAKTGKSKILIGSDLESYIEMMRQFINIGNPYEIDGLGILKLGKTGEYEFSPFDLSNKKEETRSSKKQKDRNESPLAPGKTSNRNALILFALIIILGILGVIGWGSYKLFIENKNKTAKTNADTTVAPLQTAIPDTTTKINNDSLAKQDSAANQILKVDSFDYRFIHEITRSADRAYPRVTALKQYGYPSMIDSVKTDTATYYTLYFKYKLSSADTAMMRDSVQKLLNRKIRIKQIN